MLTISNTQSKKRICGVYLFLCVCAIFVSSLRLHAVCMCQLRKLCDKLLKRDAELSCSLRNQQPIQDLVDALRSNKQDPSHDEKKMYTAQYIYHFSTLSLGD